MRLTGSHGLLHSLIDADRLSAAEKDYLEVPGNLIEDYEEKEHPVDDVPPHQMLAGLIEAKGVSQRQVARDTGIPVSTISELFQQSANLTSDISRS